MKWGSISRALLLVCAVVIAAAAVTGCGDDEPKQNSAGTGSQGADVVSTGATTTPLDPEDKNNDTNGLSTEPPPIQILTGDYSGYDVSKPTVVVAQSEKAAKAMLKRHFRDGVKRQYVSSSDFATRQQIGLFMPAQKKGTIVVISDVHEEDGQIVVTATLLGPGAGCKYRGPKPRPFHIVETRKMDSTQKPKLILRHQQASEC